MIIWEQFKPKRPASSGKGLGQDMPGSEFDHVANPKDEKTKVPKKERTKKKISQDKKSWAMYYLTETENLELFFLMKVTNKIIKLY